MLPQGEPVRSTGRRWSLADIPNAKSSSSRVRLVAVTPRLSIATETYYVEDLQSRNGTYVNGQPIDGPTRLRHGDRVRICDYLIEFEGERTADDNRSRRTDSSRVSAIIVDDDVGQTQSSITGRLGLSSDGTLQQLTASAEEKLQAFVELSNNLARALSLNDVLPPVLESLFRIFMQAESGFIVFPQPDGSLLPVATRCRRDDDSVRISRGIVNHVLDRKEAVLSADASDDSRFELTESIAQFQIRSFMCAPIVTPDGVLLGAVQIDTRDPRRVFVERDLEIILAVASQAAVSIQNAQLYEAALEQRAFPAGLGTGSRSATRAVATTSSAGARTGIL